MLILSSLLLEKKELAQHRDKSYVFEPVRDVGTPQMITGRLKSLEAEGLISREPYSQRPLRYEYRLTPKGDAFYPVLLALREWGETWCKSEDESVAVNFTHTVCGQPAGVGLHCAHCGLPLRREEMISKQSADYALERKIRWEAVKKS